MLRYIILYKAEKPTDMNRRHLLLAMLITPLAVAAEDHVQLSAHVHDVTELEIAMDADELELPLISPPIT
jgi:hypothetical protein